MGGVEELAMVLGLAYVNDDDISFYLSLFFDF